MPVRKVMGYSTTAVQRTLNPCMSVQFALSQPKKEDKKMSLTREEFDKAVELNEEIREIEGIVFKHYKPHATSYSLTWGNIYRGTNEQVAIPREIEAEIVLKIYEWYKNRLREAEDEFSALVTKE